MLFRKIYNQLFETQNDFIRVKKEKSSFNKFCSFRRTVLYSALICSMQFVSVDMACAEEMTEFIGTTDKISDTASGFNGAVPGGTYERILGGEATNKSPAVAQKNTLKLTSQYNVLHAIGGLARSSDSNATATGNAVILSKSSKITGTSVAIAGGYTEAHASSSSTFNYVKIEEADLSQTEEGLLLFSGLAMSREKEKIVSSASNNSLTIKYSNDVKIKVNGVSAELPAGNMLKGVGVVCGIAFAECKAVASNNGIAKGQDGTLTNVSLMGSFIGGFALSEKEAIANGNNFSLSGNSYKDIVTRQLYFTPTTRSFSPTRA